MGALKHNIHRVNRKQAHVRWCNVVKVVLIDSHFCTSSDIHTQNFRFMLITLLIYLPSNHLCSLSLKQLAKCTVKMSNGKLVISYGNPLEFAITDITFTIQFLCVYVWTIKFIFSWLLVVLKRPGGKWTLNKTYLYLWKIIFRIIYMKWWFQWYLKCWFSERNSSYKKTTNT